MNNQEIKESDLKNNDNTNIMLIALYALRFLYPHVCKLTNLSPEKLKEKQKEKQKENLERLRIKLQQEQSKNLNEKFIGQSTQNLKEIDFELLTGLTGVQIGKIEQNTSQSNKEICPDCKGSEQITLLISTVDCEKCKKQGKSK